MSEIAQYHYEESLDFEELPKELAKTKEELEATKAELEATKAELAKTIKVVEKLQAFRDGVDWLIPTKRRRL